IDIDHFKSINDRFGHAFGDRVIQHMGQTLRDCLPAGSVAGRLGGEEFAVLLRSTAADQALAIAERVRSAFEHATRQMSQQSFYATCCVGISNPADQLMSIDALLSDADKMLYEAKARGRNCSKIAS
ncbi:MAG: GGDEF domain-containing protein, partial [Quisquiliibacterium sp.]